MPLIDAKRRNAKPSQKPIKLTDGGGLYLEVRPTGTKRDDRRRYESKAVPQGLLDCVEPLERIARGEQPKTGLRCGLCGQ